MKITMKKINAKDYLENEIFIEIDWTLEAKYSK